MSSSAYSFNLDLSNLLSFGKYLPLNKQFQFLTTLRTKVFDKIMIFSIFLLSLSASERSLAWNDEITETFGQQILKHDNVHFN